MIKLKVNNGILSMVQNQITASYSINYYKIKIKFPESWNEFEKYATFYQNPDGERYVTKIPTVGIVNVPYEILENSAPYYVGVFGVANNVRATTNNIKIPVVEGSYRPDMILFDSEREVEVVAPDGKTLKLKGTYDGTPVSVTTNNDVNIEEMLENNHLPLSVNLDIPVYEGNSEEI